MIFKRVKSAAVQEVIAAWESLFCPEFLENEEKINCQVDPHLFMHSVARSVEESFAFQVSFDPLKES
ncbi:MAG: hypothetical protein KKC76_08155 [Proteobacteria bacterium]|nr:hypothetical protein [Pseudomonadota bacterium]MCG2747399.1 hypothetical protein [Desulfobulbaceae bacterium]